MPRRPFDAPPPDPSTHALDAPALPSPEHRLCLAEARLRLPEDLDDPRLTAAWMYRLVEPYSRSGLGIVVCWSAGAAGWDPGPEQGLWVRQQGGPIRFFGGEFGLWLAALRPLLRR
jgi:hypothetical protein